ncbi:hypothetical protein MEBOL_004805 [Melittangium boletus DSM 14713]|uniref:Uncharacterized protein n=1 Tax=Melittangium boletus DSM 14713 TaxID=1294270 RepID=A0A250IJG7_9BACT|nr:hypothetical protein MEBOL_004805 [Melittangium boletus DSM 14713]
MPSTMTGSSFTTPRDDARLPLLAPLPLGSGFASLAAPEIVVGAEIVAGVVRSGVYLSSSLFRRVSR